MENVDNNLITETIIDEKKEKNKKTSVVKKETKSKKESKAKKTTKAKKVTKKTNKKDAKKSDSSSKTTKSTFDYSYLDDLKECTVLGNLTDVHKQVFESFSMNSAFSIENFKSNKYIILNEIVNIEDILLKMLYNFDSDKNNKFYEENMNLYLFPVILLSEIKSIKAFPLIVNMFSVSESLSYHLYGDFVNNDLSSVLYNTYNGDNKLLESMIFNEKIDILTRVEALMVFLKLGAEGKIKWINLLNVVNKITRNIDKDSLSNSEIEIINYTAVFIAEFHIVSLIKIMKKIVKSKYFDQSVCGEYDSYIDKMFTYESENLISNIITDYRFETRAYINRMYDFETEHVIENSERPFVDEEKQVKKKEMMDAFLKACKFVKPDLQKNDLCYCGSGKKYKKCCINEPAVKYVYKPLSQYYDLLIDYPQVDTIGGNKGLKAIYTDKAIEMDKWFYKAFHSIYLPNYIPQDIYNESLFKAGCILNGLDIALEIIADEKIESEDEFNDKYMIHYDILSVSNAAYKMVHDNNYPVPQLNSRIDGMFFAINSKLK